MKGWWGQHAGKNNNAKWNFIWATFDNKELQKILIELSKQKVAGQSEIWGLWKIIDAQQQK